MGFFEDNFDSAITEPLQDHSPNVGTGWTELFADNAARDIQVLNASQGLRASGNGGNEGVILTAQATYPSANYEVSAVFKGSFNNVTPWYLLARVQDVDNMYAVRMVSGTNGIQLYKKVSGTWTALGSPATVADGSVVTLSVNGSTISVLDDTVEIINVTDSDIAAAGEGGLAHGGGSELADLNDDVRATNGLDTFVITEISSSGVTGSAAQTLATFGVEATGESQVEGVALITVGDAVLASAADSIAAGSLTSSLSPLSLEGVGEVEVEATLLQSIGLDVEAAGVVTVQGSSAPTLDALTVGATGSGLVERTGSLTSTLATLTVNTDGAVDVAGASTSTLDALGTDSEAAVLVVGSLAETVVVGLIAEAAALVEATADGSIELSLGVAGEALVQGSLTSTLSIGVEATGAGQAQRTGSLTSTLSALTTDAAGESPIEGSLLVEIGPLTTTSTAIGVVIGAAAVALDDGQISASGAVSVIGSFDQSVVVELEAIGLGRAEPSQFLTLRPRDLSLTLGAREDGLRLRPRLTAMTIDERRLTLTLRPIKVALTLEEQS